MDVIYSCFTTLGAGGLGVDSFELVRGLHARSHLKRGVFYGNRQTEIPRDRLRIIRFQPFQLFSSLPARYYYSLKRIYLDWLTARLIRREGCDVFHGWSTESLRSLRAVKAIGGIGFVERPSPYPHLVQCLLDEEYARQGAVRAGATSQGLLTRIEAFHRDRTVAVEEFTLADRVVLQSEFSYQSFVQMGVPKQKLLMVPRGVDTARFRPGPATDHPFRVLFVGQLCFRKGVQDVLSAWEILKLKDAELWLVGSVHDEVKGLVRRAEDDRSIRVFGHVNEPEALFQQASVFVLPSIVEGSAKVTYEAMACGLPVVVTPNAGSVAREGQEGFIVPIRDPEALADRVLRLYRDRALRDAMGQRARFHMESHTWDDHRRRMLAAYDEAWRGGRDRAH